MCVSAFIRLAVIFALLGGLGSVGHGQTTTSAPARDPVSRDYAGSIADLVPGPSFLGKAWTGPRGLLIEDWDSIRRMPEPVAEMATDLKEFFEPLGVRALGDRTFRRGPGLGDQIILRVYVFDTEQQCIDWWKRKYEAAGWQEVYRKAASNGYVARDVRGRSKRDGRSANVWFTVQQLRAHDDYVRLGDELVRRLKGKLASTTKPSGKRPGRSDCDTTNRRDKAPAAHR